MTPGILTFFNVLGSKNFLHKSCSAYRGRLWSEVSFHNFKLGTDFAETLKKRVFVTRPKVKSEYAIRFHSSWGSFLMSWNFFKKFIPDELRSIFWGRLEAKMAKKVKKRFFWGKTIKKCTKLRKFNALICSFSLRVEWRKPQVSTTLSSRDMGSRNECQFFSRPNISATESRRDRRFSPFDAQWKAAYKTDEFEHFVPRFYPNVPKKPFCGLFGHFCLYPTPENRS